MDVVHPAAALVLAVESVAQPTSPTTSNCARCSAFGQRQCVPTLTERVLCHLRLHAAYGAQCQIDVIMGMLEKVDPSMASSLRPQV